MNSPATRDAWRTTMTGPKILVFLIFLSVSSLLVSAQSDAWTWLPDEAFPLTTSSDPGGYAVLVDAVPWGAGWALGAMVYDETGDARAYLGRCSTDDAGPGLGVVEWAPLDTAWILYDLTPDASGEFDGLMLAGAWQLPTTDSTGLAREGIVQRRIYSTASPAGLLDVAFGTGGSIAIVLEGPYTEVRALAPSPAGWIAAGLTLDPCCAHREWPFLASFMTDGSPWNGFGTDDGDGIDGATIYKLGEPEPGKPGAPSAAMRHEVGGYFTSVAARADDVGEAGTGGFVAGGAYSNTAHYEPLLIEVDTVGAVNAGFGGQVEGEAGWAHWNVDPGANAWIDGVQPYAEGTWFQVRSHSGGELGEAALHTGVAGAGGDIEGFVTAGEGQLWGAIRTLDSLRMAPSWPPAIQIGPPLASSSGLPGEDWSTPADFPPGSPGATYAHFTTAYHPTLNRWALFAHRTIEKSWDVVAVFGQLVQAETTTESAAEPRNCAIAPMPLQPGVTWTWADLPTGQSIEFLDMSGRFVWEGQVGRVPELAKGPYIVRTTGQAACRILISGN